MFLGHTSGDHAYLKQGKDHVPIPVEDALVVSMGFSEGEVAPLELIELLGTNVGLTTSPYEDVVEETILPDDTFTTDLGLTTSPYVSAIISTSLGDDVGYGITFGAGVYNESVVATALAESVGHGVNFADGVSFESIEATPLLSEAVGYGIGFGGGSHV